jgi:tRNA-specific 2-thiouridylase
MQERKPRVLAAMSGGVDSAVTALLLKKAGYEVAGATARLLGSDPAGAAKLAEEMGIPHRVCDLSSAFEETVIRPFVETYRAGATPNPCICCNRTIKFGRLLGEALAEGFDFLATGHYAKISRDEASGRSLLYKAKDRAKDQSYVLYFLSQFQLKHLLFPLGEYTKAEVRARAREGALPNAEKPESQDICFIPDGDYGGFIERYTGEKLAPGDFVDESGTVLGRHEGMARYTLGQRRGTGVCSGGRLYVCAKDPCRNTVLLGSEEKLFSRSLRAKDVNFIPFDALSGPLRVMAKTRYTQKEQPARIEQTAEGKLTAEFETPQRAVTPGQAVVFYDGDLVIGGGIIE